MDKALRYLVVFSVLYAVLALIFLRSYFIPVSVNVALGLAALGLTVSVDPTRKGSWRYGVVAVLSLALSYLIPVKTFLYLGIVTAVAFAVESFAGRLNALPLFVLAFMAPIFEYFANMFSFPIRLSITGLASSMMASLGMRATAEGNVIVLNGSEFSVDPACMGLSMLTASLMAACMLIGIWQKRSSLRLSVPMIMVAFAAVILFNLLSNIIRILVLVNFAILPGKPMHDVVGLCCFMVYQLLPAAWVTRLLVRRFGRSPDARGSGRPARVRLWPNAVIALLTVAVMINAGRQQDKQLRFTSAATIGQYKNETVFGNVIKLSNDKVLVYIKPIRGFYASDHHPMICWKGNGYQFRKVREQEQAGLSIYQGLLEKGGETLYTAWWYDNGALSTTSQLAWRLTALRTGRDFSLVNITASSPEELEKQIACFRSCRIMEHLR